jgi:hypothetical protein
MNAWNSGERAKRVGVDAELAVAPEIPHNPPVLADYHAAAKQSLARLASYVSSSASAPTR